MTHDTRERILAQALGLFAHKGYEGVGVQEVVASAGVTKPTLYHHFQSKLGLLSTLLEERLAPLFAVLEGQREHGDLAADLLACAESVFAFATAQPEMYRLFLSLMFASPDSQHFAVATRHAQRHYRAIRALFPRWTADDPMAPCGTTPDHGLAPEICVSLHAALFQGMLHNHVTLFLHGHMSLDAATAQRAVQQFLYGILPRGRAVEHGQGRESC